MLPAPGSLLIASATLVDPNFARCLLLMLDSDSDGSLAVILNKPSETPVSAVLGPWQALTSEPAVLFRGGPVEGNAALALGSLRGDLEPPGWRPLRGRLGLVDLDTDPEACAAALAGVRVYAGYAGWGAGQLDAEIAEGSWHVVDATDADLFTSSPERLWRDVLRRQPTPLSLLTTMPGDANLN
jgi:putative transcriptional regulator